MLRALQETKPFFREGSIAEVELYFIALHQLGCIRLLLKIKEENIRTLFPLLVQKYSGVFAFPPSLCILSFYFSAFCVRRNFPLFHRCGKQDGGNDAGRDLALLSAGRRYRMTYSGRWVP